MRGIIVPNAKNSCYTGSENVLARGIRRWEASSELQTIKAGGVSCGEGGTLSRCRQKTGAKRG